MQGRIAHAVALSMERERVPGRRPVNEAIDGPIGRRLAELRRERNMTQVELAKRLGVPQTFVSRYELGRLRLYASHIVRICRALDVSADDLLGVKRTRAVPPPALGPRWRKLLTAIASLPRQDRQALFLTMQNFLAGAKSRA